MDQNPIKSRLFSICFHFFPQKKEMSTETEPPEAEQREAPREHVTSESCLHCALEAAMSGDKLNQVCDISILSHSINRGRPN
jgi:hypothetical protein